MRMWLGAAVVVGLAVAGPAAAESGFYVSGSGGLIDVYDDIDASVGGADLKVELDPGYFGAGALGYQFGVFRLEIEGMYQSVDVGDIDLDGAVVDGVGFDVTGSDGDGTVVSAMLNGFVDIDLGVPVKPFLGLGAGVAFVDIEDAGGTVDVGGLGSISATVIDGSETAPAAQAIAGLGFDITDHLTLSAAYRAFIAGPVEYAVELPVVGAVDDAEGAVLTQAVRLELRYRF